VRKVRTNGNTEEHFMARARLVADPEESTVVLDAYDWVATPKKRAAIHEFCRQRGWSSTTLTTPSLRILVAKSREPSKDSAHHLCPQQDLHSDYAALFVQTCNVPLPTSAYHDLSAFEEAVDALDGLYDSLRKAADFKRDVSACGGLSAFRLAVRSVEEAVTSDLMAHADFATFCSRSSVSSRTVTGSVTGLSLGSGISSVSSGLVSGLGSESDNSGLGSGVGVRSGSSGSGAGVGIRSDSSDNSGCSGLGGGGSSSVLPELRSETDPKTPSGTWLPKIRTDIYKDRFVGGVYVSVDIRTGNFRVLKLRFPDLFGDAAEWWQYMARFTDMASLQNSRHFRQRFFGHLHITPQVEALERALVQEVNTAVLSSYFGGPDDAPARPVLMTQDEVVYALTDDNADTFPFERLQADLERHCPGNAFHVRMFRLLKRCDIPGNPVFIKKYLRGSTVTLELKTCPAKLILQYLPYCGNMK
jgi:hypothetical protein